MIFPALYLLGFVVPDPIFVLLLHIVPGVTAFLFILDFPVKKPVLAKRSSGK